ncbi:hypothetical protein [Nocardiopsis sp. HUAS JQ3]|uniref:hypothetical protein n=1 Tax=Nocardiopsis sp. HUAS JQ3 TaxID=3061629 RepID=UPI0023A9641A|nr:hypothetical protein [Nocardiopsis sp. HUAS JQ3]WDZ91137.1 hypothetical protein PV789_00745 [Nocardiopsis sp. HUAS JQ3]
MDVVTARYRYVFADLVTDRDLVELDLSDVTFDRRICQAGSFRATAHVTDRQTADAVAKVIPRAPGDLDRGPGRTVVHIDRGGDLWGTYVVWQGTPQGDDRGRITVPLQGASLESYLSHREIRRDLVYAQVGDRDIARDLVADMESHGTIGLGIAAGPAGTPRDREYRASAAATYGDRLAELSEVIGGPEWMIRVFRDAQGVRRREFVVDGRLGQDATDHHFAQPGNVVGWSYPADATDVATSWQARGDTPNDDLSAESEPLLSGIWEDPRYRAAGWPLLDRTVDYQGVTSVATLDAYARWWAERRSGMLRIPQVEVRLGDATSFSPNRLGDSASITLVNDWFPLASGRPTFSHRWRIVGVEVTPVSRASGQERARLIFEEPSGHPATTTTTAQNRG